MELTLERKGHIRSEFKDFIQNYTPTTEQEESGKKYRESLVNIAYDSKKRSLVIDYADLTVGKPELADVLLRNPMETLQVFNRGFWEILERVNIDLESSELWKHRVRIREIPNPIKVSELIGNIGKFVSVRGRVKEVTSVKPKLARGSLKCKKCGHKFSHFFHSRVFKEPEECPARNCNSQSFQILRRGRVYEEFQAFTLEEVGAEPTGSSNKRPRDIDVEVRGDETGKISSGDLVEVCGVVEAEPERKIREGKDLLFDVSLRASFIEKRGTSGGKGSERKGSILQEIEDEREFNFWLSNNMDLLRVTGMDLRAVDTEARCGSNRLDILARIPQTGEKVVIESQLTKSDYNHLGKVLTYLLSVGAQHAIWITSEFRKKHQRAVNWLNSSTPIFIHTLELRDQEKEEQLFRVTNELDEENTQGQVSHRKQSRYTVVLDVIKKEAGKHGVVPFEVIVDKAKKEARENEKIKEINEGFVRNILKREKKRGVVYEPKRGRYAIVPKNS